MIFCLELVLMTFLALGNGGDGDTDGTPTSCRSEPSLAALEYDILSQELCQYFRIARGYLAVLICDTKYETATVWLAAGAQSWLCAARRQRKGMIG